MKTVLSVYAGVTLIDFSILKPAFWMYRSRGFISVYFSLCGICLTKKISIWFYIKKKKRNQLSVTLSTPVREYPSSLQLSLYLWVLLENRIVPLCWESLLVYVRGSLDQLCSPGEWTALLTDPFKSNMADGEVKVGQEKLSSMLHAGKHTDTAHLSPQLFLICRLCQRWAHWFFSLCLCALSANIVSYKSTAVKRSSSLLL